MNPALISWDFGLEINVTLEDALFSPKSMAIMQGAGNVVEGTSTTPVYIDITNEVFEFPTSASTAESRTSITLKHEFKDNSIYIYEIDDNGRWTSGEQLRGWKKNSTSSNVIEKGESGTSINTQKIAVFYKTPVTGENGDAQLIKINSDTFPGKLYCAWDKYEVNVLQTVWMKIC